MQMSQRRKVSIVRTSSRTANTAMQWEFSAEKKESARIISVRIQTINDISMKMVRWFVYQWAKGRQKSTKMMISAVNMNSKVSVEMGYDGVMPTVKLRIIRRRYPNGVYISPSLLSVPPSSPCSPSIYYNFLTCRILQEIQPTQAIPNPPIDIPIMSYPEVAWGSWNANNRRGVSSSAKKSLMNLYRRKATGLTQLRGLQVLMVMMTVKTVRPRRKSMEGRSCDRNSAESV